MANHIGNDAEHEHQRTGPHILTRRFQPKVVIETFGINDMSMLLLTLGHGNDPFRKSRQNGIIACKL